MLPFCVVVLSCANPCVSREKEEPKPQPSQWNPFSGISELVNNVLQPQSKSPSQEEPKSKLHQQFEMYKDQVKKIGEEAKSTTEQKSDSPTCGICHKTKFADGCGHVCSYCQTKFCARCGGRVSLRSNKVMWVCNLCRKQQEILTKSGAWFYSGQNPRSAEGRRLGPQARLGPGGPGPESLRNGSSIDSGDDDDDDDDDDDEEEEDNFDDECGVTGDRLPSLAVVHRLRVTDRVMPSVSDNQGQEDTL
ncbi:hypothetical protein ACEWY4_023907 [Coilia grayii]|uniref:FYVE-type domain-containing protein n=1 Tax=Coilia grayii TaxID=363190 RepID=A0ABD1IYW9_9TELE